MTTYTVYTHNHTAPPAEPLHPWYVVADTEDAANEIIAHLLANPRIKGWEVHSSAVGAVAPCGDVFNTATDANDHEATCGACAGVTDREGN